VVPLKCKTVVARTMFLAISLWLMIRVMMQDGDSCLMEAVRSKNLDVIKYLCKVGGKELIMLPHKVLLVGS
jgi:hypothetical protein